MKYQKKNKNDELSEFINQKFLELKKRLDDCYSDMSQLYKAIVKYGDQKIEKELNLKKKEK